MVFYNSCVFVVVGFRIADLKRQKKRQGKYPIEIYEELLKYVKEKGNYWHALPGEVARWWRERSERSLVQEHGTWRIVPELKGGVIGKICLRGEELVIE